MARVDYIDIWHWVGCETMIFGQTGIDISTRKSWKNTGEKKGGAQTYNYPWQICVITVLQRDHVLIL